MNECDSIHMNGDKRDTLKSVGEAETQPCLSPHRDAVTSQLRGIHKIWNSFSESEGIVPPIRYPSPYSLALEKNEPPKHLVLKTNGAFILGESNYREWRSHC